MSYPLKEKQMWTLQEKRPKIKRKYFYHLMNLIQVTYTNNMLHCNFTQIYTWTHIQHGADIESRNVRNEKEWKKAEIRKERFGGNCVTDSHFMMCVCLGVGMWQYAVGGAIYSYFLPFSSFHDHTLISGYFFSVEILSLCLFVTLSHQNISMNYYTPILHGRISLSLSFSVWNCIYPLKERPYINIQEMKDIREKMIS